MVISNFWDDLGLACNLHITPAGRKVGSICSDSCPVEFGPAARPSPSLFRRRPPSQLFSHTFSTLAGWMDGGSDLPERAHGRRCHTACCNPSRGAHPGQTVLPFYLRDVPLRGIERGDDMDDLTDMRPSTQVTFFRCFILPSITTLSSLIVSQVSFIAKLPRLSLICFSPLTIPFKWPFILSIHPASLRNAASEQ